MTTGAMAKSNSRKFGRYLQTLTPFILSPLSQTELNEQLERMAEEGESDPELDEVREAALVALDCFLASCGPDMRFYMRETIDAALRFLSYDPNFADSDGPSVGSNDDDDEDEDSSDNFDADDDVEEEGGFSDEEDMSWKVRRCAAKVLYTMIATRTKGNLLEAGTLYETIAPVLLQRFKEREENVRLEIIATMSLLVRKTNERMVVRSSSGAEDAHGASLISAHGRKRRREGSDSTALETHPMLKSALPVRSSGHVARQPDPGSSLAAIGHSIVAGAVKLLKFVSQPTRQASILLLKEIALVRPASLSESLAEVMDCIADILLPSASQPKALGSLATAATSVTGSSLRIEALSLVSVIAETHQYGTLRPLVDKLIPGIAAAVKDRLFKLSSEAINVVEHFLDVLTHVEQHKGNGSERMLVEKLYEILAERINSNNVDSEVKQQALHALGVLLGGTSNTNSAYLLSDSKRSEALNTLYERMKNETTRLAAIRAVDNVILHASSNDTIPQRWARLIFPELGGQLRKVDRALKIASVTALRDLVNYQVKYGQVDNYTASSIMGTMTPLLSDSDLHLLGPALEILASLVAASGDVVVTEDITRAICMLTTVEISPAVLEALLNLVASIGKRGLGQQLMTSLLNEVGVSGVPAVAGKVIATLLVSAGPEVGVRLDDFSTELKSARDDKRKCLALAVLGEAGFLLGAASPLDPDLFMAHFKSKSEQVPLAAAIALGRAGAANIPKYLSVILQNLDHPESSQYLLLHSIKEVLHSSGNVEGELAPYFRHVWDKVLSTASLEDNKTIAAECIGRIVVLDPKSYLPQLQVRRGWLWLRKRKTLAQAEDANLQLEELSTEEGSLSSRNDDSSLSLCID
jgi:cullin-associated NEDD8-dissociated protein 1